MKLSIKKVKNAIKGSKGIITVVAKRTEVTRLALYKFLEKHPKLKEDIQEERERLVDVAETGLLVHLDQKAPWAIGLVLKTLGKERGYVERTEVRGEVINIPTPSEVLVEIKKKRETKEIK